MDRRQRDPIAKPRAQQHRAVLIDYGVGVQHRHLLTEESHATSYTGLAMSSKPQTCRRLPEQRLWGRESPSGKLLRKV